jgi:P4 family phage/plasmid primase-like protien
VFEGDEERIALSHEWFGYHLSADTSRQKFLMGVGDGANGKQVWIEMLTGLVGADNVSHVPLELFGERFQLTATLGKLANIATEVGEVDKVAEGILKAYTSGDRMHFDRKHLSTVQAKPTARLTVTGNTLPRFRDRSSGLYRRLIILPFNVSIPIERQDPELAQRLGSELPGVFNRAIDGLRRLRAQKIFTEPAICRDAVEEYRNERDSARAYLQSEISVNAGSSIECSLLYQQYQWWCERENREPSDPTSFGKAVARRFGNRRKRGTVRPNGDRPWVYVGLTCSRNEQAPVAVARTRRSRRVV